MSNSVSLGQRRLDLLMRKKSKQNDVNRAESAQSKWSDEDRALIDWVLQHYNDVQFPVMGKPVWRWIQLGLAQGPTGELATSGKFINGLCFLKGVIEKENLKKLNS